MHRNGQAIAAHKTPPAGMGYGENGALVLAVDATPHDEFAEVLGIVRGWPMVDRLRMVEALGLSTAPDAAAIHKAFKQGRDTGRAQGQRELLQALFRGVTTGKQLIERAAVMAFEEAWPDGNPPLTAGDLAAFTGVSERTAARQKANAELSRKLSGSYAHKQRAECASVAEPALE